MKVFVNNQIDPSGGFSESGLNYETLKSRLNSFSTIYAMSCGTPVPNNNDQEMVETAWLCKRYSGKIIVDHYYAGTIGTYGSFSSGKISSEVNDTFNTNIPKCFTPFMMLEDAYKVTSQRLIGISEWYSLLFPGELFPKEKLFFLNGPERNYFLKDLLIGARENETIISFYCPFESIKFQKPIKREVRKNSNSLNGWVITPERDVRPVVFHEKIGEIITCYDLFDLQRLLGVSINGKAVFRLYHKLLTTKENSGIMIRDYSNARNTLAQTTENFGEQLIISKRIYVNEPMNDFFIKDNSILSEAPISRGETVIFQK